MDRILIRDLEIRTAGKDGGICRYLLSAEAETDLRRAALSGGAVRGTDPEEMAATIMRTAAENIGAAPEAFLEETAKTLLLLYEDVRCVKLTAEKICTAADSSLYRTAYVIERGWHTASAALSSNSGNMKGYVTAAMKLLSGNDLLRVLKNSRVARFEKTEKGECVNTVLLLETILPADELLELLQVTEASAGRDYAKGRDECVLDADLLLYDDMISSDEHLLLPHPEIAKRAYVLKGLCETVPKMIHPVLKKTMEELGKELNA